MESLKEYRRVTWMTMATESSMLKQKKWMLSLKISTGWERDLHYETGKTSLMNFAFVRSFD